MNIPLRSGFLAEVATYVSRIMNMTATGPAKVKAFNRNTHPGPTADTAIPATAGPTRRAILKEVELSPTALGSLLGGTNEEM